MFPHIFHFYPNDAYLLLAVIPPALNVLDSYLRRRVEESSMVRLHAVHFVLVAYVWFCWNQRRSSLSKIKHRWATFSHALNVLGGNRRCLTVMYPRQVICTFRSYPFCMLKYDIRTEFLKKMGTLNSITFSTVACVNVEYSCELNVLLPTGRVKHSYSLYSSNKQKIAPLFTPLKMRKIWTCLPLFKYPMQRSASQYCEWLLKCILASATSAEKCIKGKRSVPCLAP